jgi:hypothetical protein
MSSGITAGVGAVLGAVGGLVIGGAIGSSVSKGKGPEHRFAGVGTGALIGLLAGTFVGAAIGSPSAQAAPPAPTPTPPPLPANNLLAVITDPNAVRQYQTVVANAVSNPPDAQVIGVASTDYTSADIDGNPQNPRWTRVLSAFQKYINTRLATMTPQDRASLPAGFPAQLRTDGVLDYATAITLTSS